MKKTRTSSTDLGHLKSKHAADMRLVFLKSADEKFWLNTRAKSKNFLNTFLSTHSSITSTPALLANSSTSPELAAGTQWKSEKSFRIKSKSYSASFDNKDASNVVHDDADDMLSVEHLDRWKSQLVDRKSLNQTTDNIYKDIVNRETSKGTNKYSLKKGSTIAAYYSIASRIFDVKKKKSATEASHTDLQPTNQDDEAAILLPGHQEEKKNGNDIFEFSNEEEVLKSIVKMKLEKEIGEEMGALVEEIVSTNGKESVSKSKQLTREYVQKIIKGFKELNTKYPKILDLNPQSDKIYESIIHERLFNKRPRIVTETLLANQQANSSNQAAHDAEKGINWIDMYYKYKKKIEEIDKKIATLDVTKSNKNSQAQNNVFAIDTKIDSVAISFDHS